MLCVVGKFSSMNSSAFQRTKYQNFMRPRSIDSYNSDWSLMLELLQTASGLTFNIEWASALKVWPVLTPCAVYWWYLYLVPIIDIIVSLPRSSQLNIKTESSATQQQQGGHGRSSSKYIRLADIGSALINKSKPLNIMKKLTFAHKWEQNYLCFANVLEVPQNVLNSLAGQSAAAKYAESQSRHWGRCCAVSWIQLWHETFVLPHFRLGSRWCERIFKFRGTDRLKI